MIPGVRRIRILMAERRIDELAGEMVRHGQAHCGNGQPCHYWDQLAKHLDAAFDRLAEVGA